MSKRVVSYQSNQLHEDKRGYNIIISHPTDYSYTSITVTQLRNTKLHKAVDTKTLKRGTYTKEKPRGNNSIIYTRADKL